MYELDENTKEGSTMENEQESNLLKAKLHNYKRKKSKKKEKKSGEKIENYKIRIESLERELENMNNQAEKYKDLYFRMAADFENYKKKMKNEIDEIRKYTKENVYLEIISILDNFERALQSFNKDEVDEHTISIMKGITMIYKQFHNMLERENIVQFESLGEKFDPRIHHALTHKEVEDTESDIIIEEYEKGYKYKDKILRPAKVIVSKVVKNNKNIDKEASNNGKE